MTVTSKPIWGKGFFQTLSDAVWLGVKDTSKRGTLEGPSIKLGALQKFFVVNKR